uniref:Putative secreted protein n=1 Tax=Anopheles darlingi TaxID=43151 RepID=A0A2M4DR27_ANODA
MSLCCKPVVIPLVLRFVVAAKHPRKRPKPKGLISPSPFFLSLPVTNVTPGTCVMSCVCVRVCSSVCGNR